MRVSVLGADVKRMSGQVQGEFQAESSLVTKVGGLVYSASYQYTWGMHQTLFEVWT